MIFSASFVSDDEEMDPKTYFSLEISNIQDDVKPQEYDFTSCHQNQEVQGSFMNFTNQNVAYE